MTSYFCKNYKSNTGLMQNTKKYIVEHKEDPHSEMATVVTVLCIPEVFCKFIIYVTKWKLTREFPDFTFSIPMKENPF